MKRFFSILAASAAVFCTIACNKEDVPETGSSATNVPSGTCELTVGIASAPLSKAETAETINETQVKNLQVFVFNGDHLDAYGSVNGAIRLTLSCTSGHREIFALVNAPSCNNITSKKELLALKTKMSENSVDGFVMTGSLTKELLNATSAPIEIEVKRIMSRVQVKSIAANFTSEPLQKLNFVINEIYLTNVAGDTNYGGMDSPTIWYNKMMYNNEMEAFTHRDIGRTITGQGNIIVNYKLYCYPNRSSDSSAKEWSPRRTRLVIKATLGDRIYYYPITMPVLESNKSYEIEEIVITRPGSDNPDVPVSFDDYSIQVKVVNWNVVPIVDGTTI